MIIQNKNNIQRNNSISQIAFPALAGGVIASSVHELLLPVEVKGALRISKLSQDAFIQKSKEAAVETMKNTNLKINLNTIAENAKNLYPEMVETARVAKKALNKTLFTTIGLIAACKLISTIIVNVNNKKHSQETQSAK